MDRVRLAEMAYMNVPDKEEDDDVDDEANLNKHSNKRHDSVERDSLSHHESETSRLMSASPSARADHHSPRGRLTKHLVFAIAACVVGSSFQHGYNTGVVNAPERLISAFIESTYKQRYNEQPNAEQIDFIFAIIVSIFCIGGFLGALMTAIVAERIGRRNGLLINNIFAFAGAILMGVSRQARSYELMIVGRLLIGMNAGLNAGLAPLYLNEISPNHLKGAIGTVYQLVITISILIANVLGMPAFLGTDTNWHLLFFLPIVPAIVQLLTLPLCPESPRHLLIVHGHELNAQRALSWLRDTIDVHDELDETRAEGDSMKLLPPVTLREMFTNRCLRRPMTIAIVIMLSQQLSGINAVMFFSTSIFRSAGLSDDAALNATLGLAIVNVLMTLVSVFLVDRAGRRTLHMTGLMGMCISTFVLACCLSDTNPSAFVSFLSVLSLYVFITMFACGPGSIPWFLVAELFGANSRSLATSIAVAVNWFANFSVSLVFLPLTHILHGFTFLLFSALLMVFFLFTLHKVPETRGTTYEEISAIFQQ
ncbi:Solute carrier family 2, facilitated glucose transporter member 1, partial [Fragariocoptes setiger]